MNKKVFALTFCVAQMACVNGKLNPVAAPAVSTIDQLACSLEQVLTNNAVAGVVCQDIVPEVNSVLTGMSGAAAAKPCHLAQVTDGVSGYGYLCDTYTPAVNQDLAAKAAAKKASKAK